MLSNLHVTIVEARLIGEEDVDWYQERTVNSSLRNTKLTIVKKNICPCTYHEYKAIISIIYQA
jgi:hypothetical protein